MTKKDFELIARSVRHAREYAAAHPEQNADVGLTIAHTLAHELASTNPRFDRGRFLAACSTSV